MVQRRFKEQQGPEVCGFRPLVRIERNGGRRAAGQSRIFCRRMEAIRRQQHFDCWEKIGVIAQLIG
jgi:hypothetical protein